MMMTGKVLKLANRTDIALIVLAYFLSAALAAAYNILLVIWGEYVDDYSNPPEYVRDAVKETSLVILYAMILATCCHLFNAAIWSLVARNIGISLRIKYFSGLMNRPLHWLAINKRRIKCTFERDCVSLEKIISTVIPNIIKHLTTSLGGFAIALDYNWELALVGIISTGILYLAVKVSQRIQQGGEFNSERSEREREAVSTETLGVAEDGYWAFSVPEQNKEMRQRRAKIGAALAKGGAVLLLLSVYIPSLLFLQQYLLSKNQLYPGLSAGNVLVILLLVMVAFFNIYSFGKDLHQLRDKVKIVHQLFEVIDTAPRDQCLSQGALAQHFKGDITFQGVFVSISASSTAALQNLILDIRSKTTLLVSDCEGQLEQICHLILGLTSPDKGQIFIDGVDNGDLACSSLRRQIGYVATEKTPFPGTLREYLQLGQIEEKESEMSQILGVVQALHYKERLEENMHDLLRESGGVGIRLALARTLLNKTKVLLIRVQDEQEKKVLQLLLQKLIQMDYLKVIITSNSQLTIECEETIRVEQSMNVGSEHGCSNTKRGLDSGPDETEKMQKVEGSLLWRVLRHGGNSKLIFVVAVLATLALSMLVPLFAVVLSQAISSLLSFSLINKAQALEQCCLQFLLLALVGFFLTLLQSIANISILGSLFRGMVGEILMKKQRVEQDSQSKEIITLAGFNLEEIKPSLSALLEQAWILLFSLGVFAAALLLAMKYSMYIALASLAPGLPAVAIWILFVRLKRNVGRQNEGYFAQNMELVQYALDNVPFLLPMGATDKILLKYSSSCQNQEQKSKVTANIVAVKAARVMELILSFILLNVLFVFGAIQIEDQAIPPEDAMRVITVFLISAFVVLTSLKIANKATEGKLRVLSAFFQFVERQIKREVQLGEKEAGRISLEKKRVQQSLLQ